MLRLRKNKILPQQVSDLGAFIFVVTMIPTTYIWEVSKPKLELCFRAEAEGVGLGWGRVIQTSLSRLQLSVDRFLLKMAIIGTFTWCWAW